MSQHRYDVNKRAYNYPVYNAIRKYGWDAFNIRVIETVDTLKKALHLETCWIAQLKDSGYALYNLTDGGEGTSGVRHKLSTETEKYCPHCKTVKPRTAFYYSSRRPSNHSPYCKLCSVEINRKHRPDRIQTAKKDRERYLKKHPNAKTLKNPLNTATEKYCPCCEVVKPRTDFGKDCHNSDSFRAHCKICSAAKTAKRRAKLSKSDSS